MSQNVIPIDGGNDFVLGGFLHREKTMKDWERALKDSSIVYAYKRNGYLHAELKKPSAEGKKIMTLRIYTDAQSNKIVADITHGVKSSSDDKIGIDPQKAISEFLSFKPTFMEQNFGL